jgi:AcrR family transcriptional regulator
MSLKKAEGYHHGDLKNALVAAALKILQKEGLRGLTLRKTAALAGVSHNAPYRHFSSKEALVAEIARLGFAELERRGREFAGQYSSSSLRLKAYGRAYIQFASEQPTQFRIMFGQREMEGNYPELEKTGASSFQFLTDLVIECQQEGSIAAGDPYRIAAANWAYVHGLSHLLVDRKLDWMLEPPRAGKATLESNPFGMKNKPPSKSARKKAASGGTAEQLWGLMDDYLMGGLKPVET